MTIKWVFWLSNFNHLCFFLINDFNHSCFLRLLRRSITLYNWHYSSSPALFRKYGFSHVKNGFRNSSNMADWSGNSENCSKSHPSEPFCRYLLFCRSYIDHTWSAGRSTHVLVIKGHYVIITWLVTWHSTKSNICTPRGSVITKFPIGVQWGKL